MIIQEVENEILLNNQLNVADLSQLLEIVSDRKIDFGELYFLSGEYESWRLEEKIIKSGSYHRDSGAGIRAITGEKTGFAYTDQIQFAQLEKSAIAARSITQAEGALRVTPFLSRAIKPLYSPMNPLYSIEQEVKIALLSRIDEVARAEDKRIIEVNATLACSLEKVLVAATDGTLASDIRPLVRLSVNVIAEEDGKRETGSSGGGAREDCHIFFAVNPETGESFVDGYAKEAVRLAILSLSAKAAPAGTLPVILGSGWPAVLLHEAVGHGLEGDFNRKKTSLFCGKMGEKVTSELCTIIDNGHMARRRGSLTIDDEGTPTQKTVLIEKGILKNYLFDKLNAKLMGTHSTGNGRREHYSMLPMPRMTNTYMLSGKSTFDEIISSVDYGIYAPGFSGGQVDITSGKFVFSTSEAYLVESGKIKYPIKGATLIGSGIETMNEVSMVGNDLKLDPGVGVCGKAGQSVPVGVGQPTIKVNKLTVGGTS